jgi:hypothetical protein
LNTSIIRGAIARRELIEFSYKGYPRIAEPHVYGIKDGKRQILIFQVGGLASSGKIQDWRRVDLEDISGLKVAGGQFVARKEGRTPDHDKWDTVIASVE